jgi:A/G-specific adenine glycosylase
MTNVAFKKTVWKHYSEHKRDFPWRRTTNPYKILVSEIMLQQTQAPRVVAKYNEFMKTFPAIRALAQANTRDVLAHWSGLGYNRRALNLHRLAQEVVHKHKGRLPKTHAGLIALPGIGPYTAGAIMAFAHNLPHPILETNIRTVYIHHFFPHQTHVADSALMEKVIETLDHNNPREWYAALMDYGTHLKATVGNISQKSKTYTKQSTFKNSDRAIRGAILKTLLKNQSQTTASLIKQTGATKTRIATQLENLSREGFITKKNRGWSLL